MCLLLTGCSAAKENQEQLTAAINVAQGGQMAVLGNNLFYIDNQQYIWQCDLELTKGKKVITDKYIYLLCADENAIYYSTRQDRTPQWEIRKYEFNTKKTTTLIAMEDQPKLLSCYENNLLYLRNNEIYAFGLDGQTEICVAKGDIETFSYTSDGLYYAIKDTLLGSGTIYHQKSFDTEAVVVCELPSTMYINLTIDDLFVTKDSIYVRLCSNVKTGYIHTSTSYKISKSKNADDIQYYSIEDVHAQFPLPNGQGSYYLLGIGSDEEARKNFQRSFPNIDSSSTYLGSYNAGRLAFCPEESEWVDEVLTDYTYYSSAYYCEKGLILKPFYEDRYIFFGFDQK